MTFAQLKTMVSQKIGLDANDSTEMTLLGQWINQGVRDVLLRTRCKVIPATMALTAGESDYEIDATILALNEVTVTNSSSVHEMERVTPADILAYRRGQQAAEDFPRYYALDGANLLMVYPTPAAADELTLYYVPRPTEMTADANDPSAVTYGGIPLEYHHLIELYALIEAADYDDDISSQVGQKYQADYEREIMRVKRFIQARGGRRRRGRMVVNRKRRSMVPHDRSRYP